MVVPKYSRVSSGLTGGELMASTTASTPLSAASKALPRSHVNAERAADAYDLVPLPLEDRSSAGTDIAGRTGYGDSHGEAS